MGDLKTAGAWKAIAGVTLKPAQDMSSRLLSFDTSRPPFNNFHVRRAVAYSFDRAGIAAAAFGKSAALLQALVPSSGVADAAPSPTALQTVRGSGGKCSSTR